MAADNTDPAQDSVGKAGVGVPRAPGGARAVGGVADAAQGDAPPNSSTKLFVSNCPTGITDDALKGFFGEYGGSITDITWAKDEKEGKGFLGYGWVDFDTIETSTAAQLKYNGEELGENRILVSFSQPKRQMDEDPPCEHKDWADWKRLRQKNGLQHFVCIHCGTKWKRPTAQKKEQMIQRTREGLERVTRQNNDQGAPAHRPRPPLPGPQHVQQLPQVMGWNHAPQGRFVPQQNQQHHQHQQQHRHPAVASAAAVAASGDSGPPSPITQPGSPVGSGPPSPNLGPVAAANWAPVPAMGMKDSKKSTGVAARRAAFAPPMNPEHLGMEGMGDLSPMTHSLPTPTIGMLAASPMCGTPMYQPTPQSVMASYQAPNPMHCNRTPPTPPMISLSYLERPGSNNPSEVHTNPYVTRMSLMMIQGLPTSHLGASAHQYCQQGGLPEVSKEPLDIYQQKFTVPMLGAHQVGSAPTRHHRGGQKSPGSKLLPGLMSPGAASPMVGEDETRLGF